MEKSFRDFGDEIEISRSTGIPLTKSGRTQKLRRLATGGGCLVMIVVGDLVPLLIVLGIMLF